MGASVTAKVRGSLREFFHIVQQIWVAILGMGIAQAILGMCVYSSQAYNLHAFVPNFSTIVACVPLIGVVWLIGHRQTPISVRAERILSGGGIALMAVASISICTMLVFEIYTTTRLILASTLAVIGNMLIIGWWIKRLVSFSTNAVVVTSFVAMSTCELLLCATSFAPYLISCLISLEFCFIEAVLVFWVSKNPAPIERCTPLSGREPQKVATRPAAGRSAAAPLSEKSALSEAVESTESKARDYLRVTERLANNPRFLISSMFAAIIVSVAISLLWGFPYGAPHTLGLAQRIIGAVFATVVLLETARRVAYSDAEANPVHTWMAMQVLGLCSLISYTLLPDTPAWGMMFLYALNDVAGAYIWCIAVSFIRQGHMNAYCYSLGALILYLLPGSIARSAALVWSGDISAFAGYHFMGDMALTAVLGAIIVLPAQIVLGSIAKALRVQGDQTGRIVSGLTEALKLGVQTNRPSEIRRAFLDQAVASMAQTFKLSKREQEILGLYALGFTQEKIAQELHVSLSTAHTHITHIYAKTDMHSRQEIIDYLDTYTEK